MSTKDGVRRRVRGGTASALLFLLASCDAGPAGPGDPGPRPTPVAAVEVSPDTASLRVGSSRELRAILRAANGDVLGGREIRWSSSDAAVAAVDATGRVSARAEGLATITAASEGRRGSATIRVEAPAPPPPAVAAVEVSPAELVLAPGDARQLAARVLAADGAELPGRTVVWSSSDGALARVSAGGRVVALRGGVVWITATSEGKSARARVAVSAWSEAPLKSLAGAALPAVWRSFEVTDEHGIPVTRTIRIVAGRIRVNPGEEVYEQRLTMERWESTYVIVNGTPVYTGVQLRETRVFEDRGSVAPIHSGTATLAFRSTALVGQAFTGFATASGYDVTQRVNGTGDPVLLRFER